MINVNQITSRLASMPDAALQQYASLHKNDPYTVSLAMSESNRRKDMRASAQPQPGQQPTVVDQGIAGMGAQPAPQMPQGQPQGMPENTGIGTLPQPHMQKMAEGGIVAFADGGDVQRFAGGGSSLVRSTSGGKDWFLDIPETIRDPSVPYYQQIPNPAAALGEQKFATRDEAAAAYDSLMGTAAPVTPTALAAQSQTQAGGGRGTMQNDPRLAPGFSPTPEFVKSPAVAPVAPGGLSDLGGGQAPTGAPRAAAPAGLAYMDQLKKTRDAQGAAVDPEADAREELNQSRISDAEKTKSELDADIKSQEGMFDKREARQNERGEALEKSKETNKGLAFLEAGLAMMQSRGPGLAAIAQGAGVGVKQYASGLKDLKAAQEKLDEARDKTDELKQNQSSMNKKEQRAASRDIRNVTTAGQQDALNARMKIYGEDKADARAATTSDIAVRQDNLKLQSAERIARNTITRAAMTDNRADERARLAAASTLLKESGDMLNGPMANLISVEERATYLKDYNAAKAVLNSLGGIPNTPPAAPPQNRPPLGSFTK
jgi:hypothetical protein